METLQRAANRGSVPTGYEIDNSLKFEADNSEQLSRDVSSAGSRTTATTSMWVKRTELGAAQYLFTYGNTDNDNGRTFTRFQSDDTLRVMGGNTVWLNTNRVFRDTSAWYHIVIVFDTTSGTANNRTRMYINGVEETSFSTRNNPDQNFVHGLNFQKQVIGYNSIDGGSYFSGYMTEICYQDGTASAPTEFGEYDDDSGIWIPKNVSGVASGTNGFYLDFEDGSNLGNDVSGGTDFTENNLAAADQATDTPTNNFCTWNPLWAYQYQPTIKEGATVAAYGDSTDENAKATIGLTNGKWYWEAKPSGTIGSQFIGIATDGDSNISSGQGLTQNYNMTIEPQGRYYSYAGSLSESSAGQFTALTTSDTLGIALDMDSSTQTIKYYANGSLILTRDLITEMQGRTVFPFLQNYESRTFNINFGGYTINTISSAATDENGYGTFEHAPPSGYYSICSQNLALYGG
jgi:hypothetical protein